MQSTLSAPIWLHGTIVGSLNLYSTTPRAFHPRDEPVADVLAAQAATAIATHDAYHAARRLAAPPNTTPTTKPPSTEPKACSPPPSTAASNKPNAS